MRIGNKGGKRKAKKRALRVNCELKRLRSKDRGHGWAARQAARITNRRRRANQSGDFA